MLIRNQSQWQAEGVSGWGGGRKSFSHTDEGDASKVLRYPNLGNLSLYYTMSWVCILVISNVPNRDKKRNQFLPNGYCNIEQFSLLFF